VACHPLSKVAGKAKGRKKRLLSRYPRNYGGDKKIGGWEYYSCPEDMFRCS